MLGSFLEGAKATVRRAGALDIGADSGSGEKKSRQQSLQDDASSSGDVPHQESSSSVGGDTGRGVDNSSAAQSVSRSFSLLRASGARVRDAEYFFVRPRESTTLLLRTLSSTKINVSPFVFSQRTRRG